MNKQSSVWYFVPVYILLNTTSNFDPSNDPGREQYTSAEAQLQQVKI